MIIGDKIIALRKENDWSQEQLAEQLGVSRQSVSKWESGASMPDLDRIVKMSNLFGVSVDYLVRDEMEEIAYSEEEIADETIGREVSVEQADAYMNLVENISVKIAGGVALCILSPVVLILLCGFSDGGDIQPMRITENMASGIGIVVLLCMVAAAVWTFITSGMRLERFDYLENEAISLAYGVRGIVEKKQAAYEHRHQRKIAFGVTLCIAAVIPLIFVSCISENSMLIVSCVAFLLILVSFAVFLLVQTGMIWESYQKLLQEGEYTQEKKASNKMLSGFSGIYWCLITAIYLGVNFIWNCWGSSWVIWPVAGVLFAAIEGVLKMVFGQEGKG